MTTTLKQAFEKAAGLPEQQQDAFGRFLLEELEFLAAVDEGIAAADRGEVVPVEEVRGMIPKWVSESSSRNRR
jgi:predicted transcriptional regulator